MNISAQKKTYYALLKMEFKNKDGITSAELANELLISRSLVNHYLKLLLEKGVVIKSGIRPALWKSKRSFIKEFWDKIGDEEKSLNTIELLADYKEHVIRILQKEDEDLVRTQDLYQEICQSVLNKYGIELQKKDYKNMLLFAKLSISHKFRETLFWDEMKRSCPRACYVSSQVFSQIEKELKEKKIIFSYLRVLLFLEIAARTNEEIQYLGLLAARGSSTATSIAEVVNNLCQTFIFEAIDIPLKVTNQEIVNKVMEYVNENSQGKGLIVLVDFGSVSLMYSMIKEQIKGELLIVDNLTTAIGIDIGLRIHTSMKFNLIVERVEKGYHTEAKHT